MKPIVSNLHLRFAQQVAGLTAAEVAQLYRSLRVYTVGFHQTSTALLTKIRDTGLRRQVTHEFWAAFSRMWNEVLEVNFSSETVRLLGECTQLSQAVQVDTPIGHM